jgi:hypothetical protein
VKKLYEDKYEKAMAEAGGKISYIGMILGRIEVGYNF